MAQDISQASAMNVVPELFVNGVPIFGGGLIGMSGAQVFFVDPQLGSDSSTTGYANEPFASLPTALSYCVSGRGDIVVLKGGPTSTGTTGETARLAANLDWNKNNTHLLGIGASTKYGQRSRITGPASGGTFSPVMTVSASGCIFSNFSIFDDYTVDPVALKVTGSRNYFNNVNLQGMGSLTGADDAAAASLWLSGGSENTFNGCVIGLDTIPRSAANGEILMDTAAKRNWFIDCDILSYCDSATHLFVKAPNAGDLDRETIFRNCTFMNCPTGIASGLTMTNAMSIGASAGGMIVLHNCAVVGATDWNAADNGNVFISNAAPTAGTSGLAVAVTR